MEYILTPIGVVLGLLMGLSMPIFSRCLGTPRRARVAKWIVAGMIVAVSALHTTALWEKDRRASRLAALKEVVQATTSRLRQHASLVLQLGQATKFDDAHVPIAGVALEGIKGSVEMIERTYSTWSGAIQAKDRQYVFPVLNPDSMRKAKQICAMRGPEDVERVWETLFPDRRASNWPKPQRPKSREEKAEDLVAAATFEAVRLANEAERNLHDYLTKIALRQ